MARIKYRELVREMEVAGGYCTDPVGKCLREANAVRGIPKKDIDLCLRDSETYAAFLEDEDLSQRFSQKRAEKGWLAWTENFSNRVPSPKLEVWVDRQSRVFREGASSRFGCLVDVESCLNYSNHSPQHRQVDLSPAVKAEADLESCKASYQNESPTEREAIIAARRGQGRFRDAVIQLWAGKCAVTKCRALPLLRASHIKPWRDSNNAERLNPYNGLLLTPNLDAAFDLGVVSFADNGRLLISPNINNDQAGLLGLKPNLKLICVFEESRPFLAIHRQLYGFPT
jgi:hypothetical protein